MLPLLSLFTLAIWLTATQHCALEQANVLNDTCPTHCGMDKAAQSDGCSSVEGVSYRLSSDTLKVPAPNLVQCVCLLCLHRAALDEPSELSVSIGGSSQRDRDWIASWHFVRRGAPLPGAPSMLLA
jgi:hypothetical protein